MPSTGSNLQLHNVLFVAVSCNQTFKYLFKALIRVNAIELSGSHWSGLPYQCDARHILLHSIKFSSYIYDSYTISLMSRSGIEHRLRILNVRLIQSRRIKLKKYQRGISNGKRPVFISIWSTYLIEHIYNFTTSGYPLPATSVCVVDITRYAVPGKTIMRRIISWYHEAHVLPSFSKKEEKYFLMVSH